MPAPPFIQSTAQFIGRIFDSPHARWTRRRLDVVTPILRIIFEEGNPMHFPDATRRRLTSRKNRRKHQKRMKMSREAYPEAIFHDVNVHRWKRDKDSFTGWGEEASHHDDQNENPQIVEPHWAHLYKTFYNDHATSDYAFHLFDDVWTQKQQLDSKEAQELSKASSTIHVHKTILIASSTHFRNLLRSIKKAKTKGRAAEYLSTSNSFTAPPEESLAWSIILPYLYGHTTISIEDRISEQCYHVAQKYGITRVIQELQSQHRKGLSHLDQLLLFERAHNLRLGRELTLLGTIMSGKDFGCLLNRIPWKDLKRLLDLRVIVLTDEEILREMLEFWRRKVPQAHDIPLMKEMFSHVDMMRLSRDTLVGDVHTLVAIGTPAQSTNTSSEELPRVIPYAAYCRALESHLLFPRDELRLSKKARRLIKPKPALFCANSANPFSVCFLNGRRAVRPTRPYGVAIIPFEPNRSQRIRFRVTTGPKLRNVPLYGLHIGLADREAARGLSPGQGDLYMNIMSNLNGQSRKFEYRHNMVRTYVMTMSGLRIYNSQGASMAYPHVRHPNGFSSKDRCWVVRFGPDLDVIVSIEDDDR